MPEYERVNLSEVINSGPMLKEVGRWSKPARPAQAMRWSDWARSLAERHAPLTRRTGSAAMIFTRQAAFTQLHNSYRLSLNLRPTIKLAIQPLFGEMIGQNESGRGQHSTNLFLS